MTTDLDDLVRRTLASDAQRIDFAPQWHGVPARPHRAWIIGGSLAAASVATAVAIATLVSPGGNGSSPTAVTLEKTCNTTLPAAWADAFSSPMTYLGRSVFPSAVMPDGTVIGQAKDPDGGVDVVSVPERGAATLVLSIAAGRLVTSIDADDRYIVVSVAPQIPHDNPDSPVDSIQAIDTVTGEHISVADAAQGTVLGHGAVVQDHAVYWVTGAAVQAPSGTVRRFDLTTKTYAVPGDAQTIEIDRDIRGVGWVGGSVPAAHAPSGLPGYFTGGGNYLAVYSDGHTSSWQDPPNHGDIHVLDSAGEASTWLPEPVAGLSPYVNATSGPFVFFAMTGGAADYVLDTRTGAVAPLGSRSVMYPGVISGPEIVFTAAGGVDDAVRLDTTGLPELHC